MKRLLLAGLLLACLSACSGRSLIYCMAVDHDINRRCQ
jgi:hypothetical protein